MVAYMDCNVLVWFIQKIKTNKPTTFSKSSICSYICFTYCPDGVVLARNVSQSCVSPHSWILSWRSTNVLWASFNHASVKMGVTKLIQPVNSPRFQKYFQNFWLSDVLLLRIYLCTWGCVWNSSPNFCPTLELLNDVILFYQNGTSALGIPHN